MAATKAVGEASAEERTGGSTDAQQAADPASSKVVMFRPPAPPGMYMYGRAPATTPVS